jgi:hypothetical protein
MYFFYNQVRYSVSLSLSPRLPLRVPFLIFEGLLYSETLTKDTNPHVKITPLTYTLDIDRSIYL